jgi:hypothetical protein
VWLGEKSADVPQLKALLAPYPSEDMICWPVSARLGNVKKQSIRPSGIINLDDHQSMVFYIPDDRNPPT